jgi:integrase/recombinase XerD
LDELQRLANAIDPTSASGSRDAALIGLALFEALRLSEIAKLNVGDIERCYGGLKLTIKGKGGVLATIAALPPTVRLLIGLLNVRNPLKPSDPLFVAIKTGKRLSPRGIQFICDAYFRKARLRPGLGIHSLRAAHATILSANGFPLTIIQKRLRHSHIETTLAYLANCPTLTASTLPALESVMPVKFFQEHP